MEYKRKYLELTSDVIFKEFMMSEKTREFKAELLNIITKIPKKELLKAEYSSKELVGQHMNSKVYRTDIIVNVRNKNLLIIEMNKEYYDGIMQKTHQYSSRILSEELEKGENYIDVKEVIEVSFNDFSVLKHDRLINELAITNISTGEIVKEMAWVGYQIDLKVIPEKCYTESEEKIIDYFKIFSYDEEIIEGLKGKNKSMDDALEELKRISNDEHIIGLYDVEKVERKVFNSKMMTAERIGMERGMEKGMKKGMKEGLKEGKTQGLKEGVAQGTETIAINMLNYNESIENIMKYTGLTREKIMELKESNNK